MPRLLARRFDTAQPAAIEIENRRLVAIEPAPDAPPDLFVAPGLVDLQVNGYGGVAFNNPALSVEQLEFVCRALEAGGVTRFCPTLVTDSAEVLEGSLAALRRACLASPRAARRVAAIHLEGPYISPEDGPRGAHPRAHCRPPSWDEFERLQAAAGGTVRLVTLAPEHPEAPAFIERLTRAGVVAAIGHTAANSGQILAAVEAGARLSTHLGNGAHGMIRRHPNYIWDQLAEDRLWASLIVDGHHLPPAVVKAFVRAKSPERCLLVSDVASLGGMPPGRYEVGGLGAVEALEDGRLVVAGQRQYLAGAALPLRVGVTNVTRFADVSLKTAWEMASARPAELLGLPPTPLAAGADDIIVFRLGPNQEIEVLPQA